MERMISYRHNVMQVNSIETFLSVKGGFNNALRDVYFVRALGENAGYVDSIRGADRKMGAELSKTGVRYIRLRGLSHFMGAEDAAFYSGAYGEWMEKKRISFRRLPKDDLFQNAISFGLTDLLKKYQEEKPGASSSMMRNFGTKILFWADTVLGGLFAGWSERSCIKVIAENISKEQEYLFFYFTTLLGCDVLLLENKKEAEISERLKKLSQKIELGPFGTSDLPDYQPYEPKPAEDGQKKTEPKPAPQNQENCPKPCNVTISIPRRTRNRHAASGKSAPDNARRTISNAVSASRPAARSEKSFEELARLASSVVMIAIHDGNGDIIGTGSGIMIGRAGYILTNNHVTAGGRFYSVRMEEDEKTYPTDEVIKYNYNLDLAVIRIQKELAPIPIYKGAEKLVRGQRVVAIGSPLGLFNSVSDGIISGFRTIKDVNMIQFTAPTSPGSSGGAVLNMNGEVIGISTAGMDNGQNLNLAVGYEDILMFTQGFRGV